MTPLTFRDNTDLMDLEVGEFSYEFAEDGPSAFLVWPPTMDVVLRLPIYEPGQPVPSGVSWQLSGTRERPTLSPSIAANGGRRGTACHGFVREGAWEECG